MMWKWKWYPNIKRNTTSNDEQTLGFVIHTLKVLSNVRLLMQIGNG